MIYFDPSGTKPKWWQWTLSKISVVDGALLLVVLGAQVAGAALIGGGIGSIAGGYIAEKNDHEHCEFCSKKITDLQIEQTERSGYVYYDERTNQDRWICESCFNELKQQLNLKSI